MKNILMLIIIACSSSAIAQVQLESITWHSSLSLNLKTNDSLQAEITFISDSIKVEMVQGQYTIPFTIEGVSGTWTDIEQSGNLTYAVKDDADTSGSVVIGRDQSGLYLILDMTLGNPDGIWQRFTIDEFDVN